MRNTHPSTGGFVALVALFTLVALIIGHSLSTLAPIMDALK